MIWACLLIYGIGFITCLVILINKDMKRSRKNPLGLEPQPLEYIDNLLCSAVWPIVLYHRMIDK